jgi:hypothetical protein
MLSNAWTMLALDDVPRLTIQVIASLGLVAAVLWFMWKLPASGERFFAWAPPLALMSAWAGLVAVVISIVLWWLPGPDVWITGILLVLDPAALCGGILVLWIYRRYEGTEPTVTAQRTQARAGIILSLIAVTIGYIFVMTHKTPFSPVGQ